MARTCDTYAHKRVDAVRRLFLAVLRHGGFRRKTGGGTRTSPMPLMPEASPPVSASMLGLDYTDWKNPLLSEFSSGTERIGYMDGGLLVRLVEKYKADGHAHTGAGDDGPLLSAGCVLLDPETSLLGARTAQAHVDSKALHPDEDAPSNPFGRIIPIDDTAWFAEHYNSETLTVEEIAPTIVGGALSLSPEPVVLKMSALAWINEFVMDFDLSLGADSQFVFGLVPESGMVRVRANVRVDGIFLTNQNSSEGITPGIAEETWVHVRILISGSRARITVGARSVESSAYTIPSAARICLYTATSEGQVAYVKNVSMSHTLPLDVRHLSDFHGILSRTGAVSLHAETHEDGGTDELTTGLLPDPEHALLSAVERVLLLPDDKLHGHDARVITLDGGGTFEEHMADTSIHSGGLASRVLAGPLTDADTTIRGRSGESARRDHTHGVPMWRVTRLVREVAAYTDNWASDTTIGDGTSAIDVPTVTGEYIADGLDPNSVREPTRTYTAGEAAGLYEEHIRLEIGLTNLTDAIVWRSIILPNAGVGGSAWASVTNDWHTASFETAIMKVSTRVIPHPHAEVALMPGDNLLRIYFLRRERGAPVMVIPVTWSAPTEGMRTTLPVSTLFCREDAGDGSFRPAVVAWNGWMGGSTTPFTG